MGSHRGVENFARANAHMLAVDEVTFLSDADKTERLAELFTQAESSVSVSLGNCPTPYKESVVDIQQPVA